MRKIIVLAVLLLAVGAFFVQRHLNVDINPAAFLPADTLVYVDQREAEKRGQRFLASPLGKAIVSIDLSSLVHDLGVPEDVRIKQQETLDDLKEFANNKITAELLGDHFVVAVLPWRDWMKEPGVLPDVRRQLVLLCKPRHGAATVDLLASTYSGDLKTDTIPYGKYSLKRFKNDKLSFVACATDGWLVAAFEERALRESLDTLEAGANALAGDGGFKKIAAILPPESAEIVYLRLGALAGLAKEALARVSSPDQAGLAEQLDGVVAGLDALAYGSRLRDGVLEERMLVSFLPDKATAAVRKILSAPPRKDEFADHLRDNLLFYSYSGVSDWSGLDSLEPEYRAAIETTSGHSVQELRGMLGDGASRLYVRKSEEGQTVPLPLVNFCMTAAEPEKLNDTASTILARAGVEMTKGKFQDASYQVWNKAPEKNMRFYSALWRGQWCLGNSLDFFKEIAEKPPAGESLLAAQDFKAVDNDIDQPANSLMYIRADRSLDLLHDVCGWFAAFLAVKDRELSAKAKLVNERVIFPILAGAKMYQRSFSRGVVENNMLRIDARTSMAPMEAK